MKQFKIFDMKGSQKIRLDRCATSAARGAAVLAHCGGAAASCVAGARAAAAIVGRSLLYNWPVVGWCAGVIESANGDGRRKMGGEVINFLVHYEVDGDTSSHVLIFYTFD